MYKGYKVVEEVVNDYQHYQHPEINMVLQAPCGCIACESEVQSGHFACSTSPAELTRDHNITAVLNNNRWYWVYYGPDKNVDEWLESDVPLRPAR